MRDRFLTFAVFLRNNVRWLAGGLLLTFFSSVGQTFFIAMFAGHIRADFALSHGQFGGLYMSATLLSAVTLIWLGKLLDHASVHRLAMGWIVCLTVAALIMATAYSALQLLLALYMLRLFGQGMMTHTAMVAVGRWFHAERGRAVSIASAGHQLGEAILPLTVVALLLVLDWRWVWAMAALVLVLLALPVSYALLSTPRTATHSNRQTIETGHQWTRAEVLRDMPFWAVCTGVLAPAFIGTSVFFHQVHLSELKGWPIHVLASSFVVMSVTSVTVSLVTGQLIDRYGARKLLPFFLLPLGVGCMLLSSAQAPSAMAVFMALLGTSYGISTAVFGAIWPENYGVRHLGSIRAVVSAAMVFSSALGPGLSGWLIDRNVGFEVQLMVMSAYCLLTMLALLPVSRTLERRSEIKL